VLVLWAPYLKGDSQAKAEIATRYLADNRVRHFWDLWRFGTRVYSEQFSCRPQETWDIYVIYGPELAWKEAPPQVDLWLHSRNLEKGTRFSKESLEAGILEWTR